MSWVHDVMTRTVVSVAPTATVGEAIALASAGNVDYVPVVERGRVLGLLNRDELNEAMLTDAVAGWLQSPITVSVDATVDEAAALMNDRDIGCLLVTDDCEFYGVVTRGDLLRAGVPEAQVVGERRCSACGTHHGVHRRGPNGLMLCASCLERGQPALPDDELGVGD
jgi:CBS domain-containing protein